MGHRIVPFLSFPASLFVLLPLASDFSAFPAMIISKVIAAPGIKKQYIVAQDRHLSGISAAKRLDVSHFLQQFRIDVQLFQFAADTSLVIGTVFVSGMALCTCMLSVVHWIHLSGAFLSAPSGGLVLPYLILAF